MVYVPAYIFILFFLITIDYFAGILIENAKPENKKIFLSLSILATCLVLFYFKYKIFVVDNIMTAAHFFSFPYMINVMQLLLPVGLSFHTFQSLSYVIEVYRGAQKAERNFGIYALYVMFYPQLVAGPIERPYNLIKQFYEKHFFEYKRVTDGLKLMAWGIFRKIVIADRLAIIVNLVYGEPGKYTGYPLIIATVLFAFQIYCDFSGYSDIAIGAAQVMGFKLMRNFDRPYFQRRFPSSGKDGTFLYPHGSEITYISLWAATGSNFGDGSSIL
jgi:alginate O-acetyltransferase complex protein AlgI